MFPRSDRREIVRPRAAPFAARRVAAGLCRPSPRRASSASRSRATTSRSNQRFVAFAISWMPPARSVASSAAAGAGLLHGQNFLSASRRREPVLRTRNPIGVSAGEGASAKEPRGTSSSTFLVAPVAVVRPNVSSAGTRGRVWSNSRWEPPFVVSMARNAFEKLNTHDGAVAAFVSISPSLRCDTFRATSLVMARRLLSRLFRAGARGGTVLRGPVHHC